MATSSKTPTRRVMLWALPRTLSTVFLKMMSFVDEIQVISEPNEAVVLFGPERDIPNDDHVTSDFVELIDVELKEKPDEDLNAPLAFDETICTYKWVKKTLEADYPGKKLVFCKAMVTALDDKYSSVPEGFKHTFIIRNPMKVFPSTRKVVFRALGFPEEQEKDFRLTDMIPQFYNPPKHMFGEMVDLLHYLRDNKMESNPVIIDADDLQNHPESILKQYFEAIGIPFNKDLLQMEAGDGITSTWIASKKVLKLNKSERGGYYGRALASTHIEPTKTTTPDESELTPDVVELAKAADKYYKELYEMRLKP